MNSNIAVIHYHEIALKGKNRAFFERALLNNIQKQTAGAAIKVKRIAGRLIAEYKPEKENELIEKLKHVFGVHHFELGPETTADTESMKKAARNLFAGTSAKSFRVTANRSEKKYPFTSHDIEVEVGRVIDKELKIPVDLSNPETTLSIEVVENKAYLSIRRVEGLGGLPVGVSGKVVCLLSNGFDSPVATLRMMKRGCAPILVHFHSYPNTSRDAIESVKKIAEIISRYVPFTPKLFLVPFADIQKFIVANVSSPLRVVMYRRWMLWIAEQIAKREEVLALVTGDSVGQVASQTLENIATVSEIVSLPILRPLAGHDKEEIINLSKFYGTYDISKLPYDDCCSLFLQGSPKTNAGVEEIKVVEKPVRAELEKLANVALLVSTYSHQT